LALVTTTHPFAPDFSVPVAIKELVEVASLFELAAKSFAGFVGGAYLNYRFGWKAFHRDVQTLTGIMKHIEHRIKVFNRLIKQGNTRMLVELANMSQTDEYPNTTLHSAYSTTVRGTLKVQKTMKTWGTVRWRVVGDVELPVDELEKFNLAVKTVFDLGEIDAPTMWELLPFSWLVDYFYNVGDILQSQHMRYLLQPTDICIMRHYSQVTRTSVTQIPSNVSLGNEGYYLRDIKSRDVVNVPQTPSLSFDLITHDRWKVIAALAAKFRG
jgi:hypothetical protein